MQKVARSLGVNASDILRQTNYLRMWLKPQDLDVVARFDEVCSISEVPIIITQMWTARVDTNVKVPASYPEALGLDAYTAADEIVAVADSGITVNHPAFLVRGSEGIDTKVKAESW